ncbi:hypothetical protein [Dietzia sp. 179-F 9C3 NHS]|uniref:hypothetical protein n=1 Tax=Dietzia sp. 179-F 9C3 NHS TaxID=3374295 RepID=UPI00387A78C1
MNITLSDLQITPAGPYVAAGTPAPCWEANMDDDAFYWGSRYTEPLMWAVGGHEGPSLVNVTGAPGLDLVLDVTVNNDGFTGGPMLWLSPVLRHAGRPLVRLGCEPVFIENLLDDYLDEHGDVIASPHTVHATEDEFLAVLAPRVCQQINAHLATQTAVQITVPDVPDWQRDQTIVTITVPSAMGEDHRPAAAEIADRLAAHFRLDSLAGSSTVAGQAEAFGMGLRELAPALEWDGILTRPDTDGAFLDATGPVDALTPAARRYLSVMRRRGRVGVETTIDGAHVLGPQ